MGDEGDTLLAISQEIEKDGDLKEDSNLNIGLCINNAVGNTVDDFDLGDVNKAPCSVEVEYVNEELGTMEDIHLGDTDVLAVQTETKSILPESQGSIETSNTRKENPFDKIKNSDFSSSENSINEFSDSGDDDNLNNLDGMDYSLPTDNLSGKISALPGTPTQDEESSTPLLEEDEVQKQKQPMVVSVGTIEVVGTFPDKYEDINIMKKGDIPPINIEQNVVTNTQDESEKSNDYESLRDVRFSSVSIYDKPHFEEDIDIVVDDAQKHQAESFVSYKVVTKTTRESFQQHEFHVRRRYQDFLWLANTLTIQYPTHIIPPLPQKKMFNRYDPDFLRIRQLALNKFLCRIAEHPILSTSENFFTFLSAKQVELLSQKKLSAPKGFNLPNVLPIGSTTSPFETTSEYITEFSGILSTLTSHSTKLEKEQLEQIDVMKTLPPTMALWANVEGDLEPVLVKVGETVTNTFNALEEHVRSKEEIFNESIKEYQLYVNVVKNVLRHRDSMQITKDYFNHSALSKQAELEKTEVAEPGKSLATFFGKSPNAVKEDKIKRLKKEIADLSTSGEEAGDALVVANANIKSDLERWKINKEKDCRKLLSSVADSHTQYYQNALQNWNSLIEFIDNTDSYN